MLTRIEFLEAIKPSQRLFQIIGLLTQHFTSSSNSIQNRLLKCYSIGIGVCIVIVIANRSIDKTIHNEELNILIDSIVFLAILIVHIIIIIETLVNTPRQAIIIKNFYRITCMFEQCCASRACTIADRNALKKIHQRNGLKIWGTFLTITFIKINGMLPFLENAWPNYIQIVFSWTIMNVRMLQVTIDVDQLGEQLIQLGKTVRRVARIPAEQQAERIARVAAIYSIIRTTNIAINETYGWSLVAILTQNVMGLIQLFYWTLYNVRVTRSLLISFSYVGITIDATHRGKCHCYALTQLCICLKKSLD